jgi:hypothetical protein
MNTTPAYLTPSEQVYLNGEKFIPKGGVFNTTRLIHMDYAVGAAPLAQTLVAAAFLTLEQQGTLRLEIRQKKVMFGLASSKALFADAVGQMAAWPAYTIESALPGYAYQLAENKNQNEVHSILYAWLGQDSMAPFEALFDRIKYGLAARGLLETRQETHLKIFKSTAYVFPEGTRQLAAIQPLEPVQQLLGWYQQSRPEIYSSLFDQIKKGISARQERTDNDTNFDNN